MDKNIFDTLEIRMPWTLANRAMKRAGLDGSQGWDGARQKYQEVDHADAENFLKELLRQHALCGEKMTKLYPVEEGVQHELREAIEPRRVCRRLIDLSYAAMSDLSRAA